MTSPLFFQAEPSRTPLNLGPPPEITARRATGQSPTAPRAASSSTFARRSSVEDHVPINRRPHSLQSRPTVALCPLPHATSGRHEGTGP